MSGRHANNWDTAEVRTLYETHVQYLFSVCRRYITDPEDAKDVLQESFIKIFNNLHRFEERGPGSMRAWMRRIVVNESLSRLRTCAGTQQLRYDELQLELPDEDPQIEGIPLQVLQEMIRSLPDGYRTVFNLRVFEEMEHKEIASLLGISENTSYSQFSRARALLAHNIKKYRNNGR